MLLGTHLHTLFETFTKWKTFYPIAVRLLQFQSMVIIYITVIDVLFYVGSFVVSNKPQDGKRFIRLLGKVPTLSFLP